MDSFIKLSNFGKIAPYAQLFRQGLLVTVLLSMFTVAIGFVLALILALMRMSNIRPFRALAVDRNGHLREGETAGMAVQIQSPFFYSNCLRRNPSFHPGTGTDFYHLLRRVRNDRSSVFPDVWIY